MHGVCPVYDSLIMFDTGAIPMKQASFGSGSGIIVLDDLDCSGSEGSLFECPSDSPVLVHDCDHSEDAGVRCLCMSLFCC